MRLIDADQFEVIAYKDTAGRENTFDAGVQYMAELIDAAPTVDAVPVGRCKNCKYRKDRLYCRRIVDGRWEFLGPNRLIKECMCGTCSVCKVRSKYIVNTMLCPNCGARMDGEAHGKK